MPDIININNFLEISRELPVIDVRSPCEFAHAHIPFAHNLPLFTDEERALVGTRYNQSGKEDAILFALKIVGTKLADYVNKASEINPLKEALVHCWRGGMRSNSMGWLLETAGFKIHILEGGYREYRRYVRKSFEKKINILILGGMTGSGKTEILKQISEKGNQVLDLEKLASHRGSVLGSLGQSPQPTNEQFENNLFYEWNKLDFSKPVWIEDESFQLGYVNIPQPLYAQMETAPVINIQVSKEFRIKRLVHEYSIYDIDVIKQCLIKLEKRIGGKNLKIITDALDNKDFSFVSSLLLDYYDKTYSFALAKRNKLYELETKDDIPSVNAEKIIDFANSSILH